MTDKYILNGHEPVAVHDLLEWGRWLQINLRHVAQDEPMPGVRVSTVFLGLDHRFGTDKGPPILFETMVFGGEFDQLQERYCTWDEAEKGHAEILQRVLAAKEH